MGNTVHLSWEKEERSLICKGFSGLLKSFDFISSSNTRQQTSKRQGGRAEVPVLEHSHGIFSSSIWIWNFPCCNLCLLLSLCTSENRPAPSSSPVLWARSYQAATRSPLCLLSSKLKMSTSLSPIICIMFFSHPGDLLN